MEYQVVILPKRVNELLMTMKNNDEAVLSSIQSTSVHSWNDRQNNSLCLAFPYEKGQTLLTIIFPGGKLEEFKKETGFEEPISSLFGTTFDSETRKEIIKQLKDGVAYNGGYCIWPNHFGVKNIVLVGDSAHGMWPALGQGANCALESAAVFLSVATAETLLKKEGERDEAISSRHLLDAYEYARYDDAMAAVNLTHSGFGGSKSRHAKNAPIFFFLQLATMMALNKLTLGILVPKPAMLRLMNGDEEGYNSIRKHHQIYEKIIVGITTGVVVVVAIPVAHYIISTTFFPKQ